MIIINKYYIRKKYIEVRNELSFEYINNASINIANKIRNLEEYIYCENIFIFLTMSSEINTKYIIENALLDCKKIYAPVLTKIKREMIFKRFEGFDKLIKNNFGILEPKGLEVKQSDDKTLIIVPSIVYTKDGYRVGYGGGYYDKYLSENTYYRSVGISFLNLIISDFEKENFDKKVDILITN